LSLNADGARDDARFAFLDIMGGGRRLRES